MSGWESFTEEGVQWWIHEEYGNIMKQGDVYIGMVPKVVKIGPFLELEKAQEALSANRNKRLLEQKLDEFSEEVASQPSIKLEGL